MYVALDLPKWPEPWPSCPAYSACLLITTGPSGSTGDRSRFIFSATRTVGGLTNTGRAKGRTGPSIATSRSGGLASAPLAVRRMLSMYRPEGALPVGRPFTRMLYR
jgi:hypothetical protein